MRLLPGAPVWTCDVDALTCQHGHPVGRTMRDCGLYLRYHGAGIVTFTCGRCTPHSYAFGFQIAEPDELVQFYATTREGLEHALDLWQRKHKLRYILTQLGYGQEAA